MSLLMIHDAYMHGYKVIKICFACGRTNELTDRPTEVFHEALADLKITINVIVVHSAQRVPEPDPLPGIYFDTRPDPI